jgi:manganese-dependent inorganic pyrophosphatase
MELVSSSYLESVPLFNVLSVLEGKVLNEAGESVDSISGEVTIALPQSRENLLFNKTDSIVLCGHQPDMIRRALEMNVRCLVLCQAELAEEFRCMPTQTCIISTPYDAYRAARLIFQSTPIGRICRTTELVCFHLEDRLDEVREQVLKHRDPCYPILDENEQVAGVLTRYHLLRPRRKRVVLVDHNEAAQSVPGLEEAEILEIIDHHRLADIQTANPIYVRNEPVGSTNTIIASMFQDRGLMPSEKMAGMMAAAILSDTVMFKSPTCTDRDRRTAQRMARIANVSLEELGKLIFSVSTDRRTTEELLYSDYKEFHIAGHDLAVAQITCVDSPGMLERKEEFLELMKQAVEKKKFSMMILMLTDVLLEGTQIIYLGSDEIIQQAFSVQPKDNTVFLPKIMSRKKQVIPLLSALWG